MMKENVITYTRRKLSCTMMYGVRKYVDYMYHTKIVMYNEITFLVSKVLMYIILRKCDILRPTCKLLCAMMYANVIILCTTRKLLYSVSILYSFMSHTDSTWNLWTMIYDNVMILCTTRKLLYSVCILYSFMSHMKLMYSDVWQCDNLMYHKKLVIFSIHV